MRRAALVALTRMTTALFVVFACVAFCRAQSQTQTQTQTRGDVRRQSSAQSPTATQTPSSSRSLIPARSEADEDFDLDITERRITELNFFASTEVSAGDEAARGLALRVGVEVGAGRIDVLLRNVRGHVRFRASLDALRRVLDARRATNAVETTPVVP
jgi:hypothetical protein